MEIVTKKIQRAFRHGLKHEDNPKENSGIHSEKKQYLYRPIKMLPTHLSVMPDGSEEGRFFALDLGGTNLRFLEINIREGRLVPTAFFHVVPTEIQTGTCEELFNFMAKCIEHGLKKVKVFGKKIKYFGFTFSFPCNQTALNSATLLRWTKGFSVSGVEGEDVVKLLRGACNERKLNIEDFILINDTTGTLLCGAFENSCAVIAIINGTGANACYLEKSRRVRKLSKGSYYLKMIINTEMGSFGENGELFQILTEFDKEIDATSINPGRQIFEKMISGMYLGKLVRLTIIQCYKSGILFKNGLPGKFYEEDGFTTSQISNSYNKDKFMEDFMEKYNIELTLEDYLSVFKICQIVSQRSATLCALALSALIDRIECEKCVIAADGSLFSKHPTFKDMVDKELRGVNKRDFEIILVNDGSGKGAALAACVATNKFEKNADISKISSSTSSLENLDQKF